MTYARGDICKPPAADRECFWRVQEELEQSLVLPLERMVYNEVARTYVVLERAPNSLAFDTLVPTLHFRVKEIDPSTGKSCCF